MQILLRTCDDVDLLRFSLFFNCMNPVLKTNFIKCDDYETSWGKSPEFFLLGGEVAQLSLTNG